ncbi:MAG TPA: TetR family transcriptional regulator C-terminal domain-containing protein [Cyclobacteriaceae bacterium]
METTKKPKGKASTEALDKKIVSAYKEHILLQGSKPVSIYKFCLDLGIKEDDFYNYFGSFEGLENHIWKSFVDDTIARLNSDKTFSSFTARERILAFYYTLFEELKGNRSYILVQLSAHKKLELPPSFLKGFKASYEAFIGSILTEGKSQGEVANRPYLDKRYPQLFWFHISFILLFWKEDSSAGFESTDAAIEKSINLAFDLIGKGAVDSAIDLAKFLYQIKMK